MPSANDMVTQLQSIANEWRAVATMWHLLMIVPLTSLAVGWRPSARLVLAMLAMPMLGVGAVAGVTGNAFNSRVFTVLGLTLVAMAFTRADDRVRPGTRRAMSIGVALVAFGAAYPHFVDVRSWIAYLYAAPVGILPCPTLAVVIGVLLMLDGCDSPAASWTLALTGLFYAAVGMLWLGVMIDAVLFAGALALAVHAASMRDPARRRTGPRAIALVPAKMPR